MASNAGGARWGLAVRARNQRLPRLEAAIRRSRVGPRRRWRAGRPSFVFGSYPTWRCRSWHCLAGLSSTAAGGQGVEGLGPRQAVIRARTGLARSNAWFQGSPDLKPREMVLERSPPVAGTLRDGHLRGGRSAVRDRMETTSAWMRQSDLARRTTSSPAISHMPGAGP